MTSTMDVREDAGFKKGSSTIKEGTFGNSMEKANLLVARKEAIGSKPQSKPRTISTTRPNMRTHNKFVHSSSYARGLTASEAVGRDGNVTKPNRQHQRNVRVLRFVSSSDISANFRFRVSDVEGSNAQTMSSENRRYNVPGALYYVDDAIALHCYQYARQDNSSYRVRASLLINGEPFQCARNMIIAQKSGEWSHWQKTPLLYSELPRDTILLLEVLEPTDHERGRLLGVCRLRLFDASTGWLRTGTHKLKLFKDNQTCAEEFLKEEKLKYLHGIGKHAQTDLVHYRPQPIETLHERVLRVSDMCEEFAGRDPQQLGWLDRLTMQNLSEMLDEAVADSKDTLYLTIELPRFPTPVLFQERKFALTDEARQQSNQLAALGAAQQSLITLSGDMAGSSSDSKGNEIKFPLIEADDYDVVLPNPIDQKHYVMSKHQIGVGCASLKPTGIERRQLRKILDYPPFKVLSEKEKEFLWKFRYYLRANHKALAKFLRCVEWSDKQQVKVGEDMLSQWSRIDVVDALELLSSDFEHPSVRKYAVKRLESSKDDEIQSFLLQLVQALRYEKDESNLSLFLVERSIKNHVLANFFYWYLQVECKMVGDSLGNAKSLPSSSLPNSGGSSTRRGTKAKSMQPSKSPLELSSPQPTSNPGNHGSQRTSGSGIKTLSEDVNVNVPLSIFHRTMQRFQNELRKTENGRAFLSQCEEQQNLVRTLVELSTRMAASGAARPKKIQRLRNALRDSDACADLRNLHGLPLPLDPGVVVHSVVPGKATIFKSAMAPLGISFDVEGKSEPYRVIFKMGDDLRQDQLIMQLVSLMNKLLLRENMDLKLSPYPVLASSNEHGMVYCVPRSHAVAAILKEFNYDIRRFLQKHHGDATAEYGIKPEVLDTFVKSCAGYSVITYLLGIGDRHLDNLLITEDGRLFHIDFGFILGRDPKPLPPPMKLCKEMVEAMGGSQSKHYEKFKIYACEAYNILRKSSNLILNLFALMIDADIPDLKASPKKSLLRMNDKFRSELTDSEASQAFQNLINESVSALFPQLTETIHRLAQWARK